MRLLSVLFFFNLVLLLQHTALGQGFSVSPSRITLSGNPSETVTQAVNFTNSSNAPLTFSSNIQDWDRDSVGVKVYYPKNSRSASNASWLTLSSNSVTIQPGQSHQLILSMTIPATAKELTHSMLFFKQVKEQQPKKTATTRLGVNVLIELGIQVYYTPPGLAPGELNFLAFEDRGIQEKGNTKTRQVALKIQNTGKVNKDGFIRMELTNKDTGEEIKVDAVTLAILPEKTQWVIFNLPISLKGKFLAVALLDAGPDYDLKVAEKEIIYRP